ncbi:UDP-N-acetyl-D-mannosamine dehydrogenase protein [Marine Group I thaumarchaeote SCGC AAA799-B03]|uniref:UDP-N-acetyl-D-mannosamine dehydrogenase n=1 Tax=Marine Group I thaumarchaeote SCGC AAA799-B03 TaxID=1502289 RepID=A0A087S909_9ARCH|nr:UDP-N-acetyl-D-mannosamine dehydrogenase protein [Marine Group I thaumarchaeote SCGC AAA799-B03]
MIVVIGLGFVGLTLSLALAEKGVTIHGIEANKQTFEQLSTGSSPINEKEIDHYLHRTINKNFFVHQDLENVQKSDKDIYIICVGTPLDQTGNPNLSYIENAVRSVGKKIQEDDLVILRSTVPVGTTLGFVSQILKEEMKKRNINSTLNIAFAPERTAEGKALKELTELPQIIGGINKQSVLRTTELFHNLTPIIITVSTIETAEMIKLIDNSYRDVQFAYSNEVALICEKLNLDANECISKANIHYKRNNVPLPSPGVGGPCLSKDPYILMKSVGDLHYPNSIISFSRNLNEIIPSMLAHRINSILTKLDITNPKIFIMGFAFKGNPETNDVRNSPTLSLVSELKDSQIFGHDYLVNPNEIEKSGAKPSSIEEGFKNADCVIIVNNHIKYGDLDVVSLLESSNKPCLFVDCWRLYDKKIFEGIDGITYTGVGIV